jgi:hypothetical protein
MATAFSTRFFGVDAMSSSHPIIVKIPLVCRERMNTEGDVRTGVPAASVSSDELHPDHPIVSRPRSHSDARVEN